MSNEIEVSVELNHDNVDLIVPYEVLGLLKVAEVDGEYVSTKEFKAMASIIEDFFYNEGQPRLTDYADTVKLMFTFDTVVHSKDVNDVEIRAVCAEFTVITECESSGVLHEQRYNLGFESVGGFISEMLVNINDIDTNMVREGALEMAEHVGRGV